MRQEERRETKVRKKENEKDKPAYNENSIYKY